MDDRQKTRLVMLAISGILLGAGWYGYVWYQEQKTAQLEEEQVPIANVRRPMPKPAPNTVATPPVVAQAPVQPAVTPPVQAPAKPPVTAAPAPVAAQPPVNVAPAQPAAKPPVTPQVAAKPPVVAPTLPAAKPPVAAQVAVKPPAVVPTPPAAKPLVAAQVAVKPPVTAPTSPAAKPPVAQPSAVAAVRPTPKAAAPAAEQQATAAPPAQVVVVGPNGKSQYLATTMDSAVAAATTNKGRLEPTRPVDKFLPWPRTTAKGDGTPDAAALLALVPPPPPDNKPVKPKKIDEKLVPPPPPEATGAGAGLDNLDIGQLPLPPSRPTIGDKMKVIGVFDDKAIIAFPRAMQIKNKWPRTITLGTGQQFESLTIVSINRDGVTIEEDGERSMKPISAVK